MSKPIKAMTIDDVASWLGTINLSKHAAVFRLNKVDGVALLEMAQSEFEWLELNGDEQRRVALEIETLKHQGIHSSLFCSFRRGL